MGVRSAHEACVQRARYPDVIDEAAAPGEQRRIFEARDAGAEMFRAHGRCPGTAQRGNGRYTGSVALQSRNASRTVFGERLSHLSMAGVLWLWRPDPASAGPHDPEIVSRRGLQMLDVSADPRRSARPPAGPPLDFQAHLAALEAQGLLVRVDRPINKDTELHPLVRWQFQGGLARRSAPRVPVHQRHGFVRPAL